MGSLTEKRYMNFENESQRYQFTGHEFDQDTQYGYHGARYYSRDLGRYMTVDPLASERSWVSPYNFVQNNPLSRIDPTGAIDEPVYGSDGTHRGDTKEGFTGEVIIYDGDVDFSKMSKDELLSINGADTYDNQRGSLTGDAKSNIWTHIASQLEGATVFDKTFSMSTLRDVEISYSASERGSWISRLNAKKITGTDKYKYETTVENIQSSIVVHEWYSHIQKKVGSYAGNHRLAYENVIKYTSLWDKTTDSYKSFNVNKLQKYTKRETSKDIEAPFLNIYNQYK